MKVWDQAGIELATPGSVVRLASVARHVTDCTMRPSTDHGEMLTMFISSGSTLSINLPKYRFQQEATEKDREFKGDSNTDDYYFYMKNLNKP